ncbi:MAG: high-potential iron-sulfur protein [Sphingobacterium sp.]
MHKKKIERREFIKGTVTSSLAFLLGSAYVVSGCTNSGEKADQQAKEDRTSEAPVSSCDDYSQVDEVNLRKREQLGYVKQTVNPENKCENCKLWIPPKEGHSCGGCMLFKGPVYDEGYCTYWAPQD